MNESLSLKEAKWNSCNGWCYEQFRLLYCAPKVRNAFFHFFCILSWFQDTNISRGTQIRWWYLWNTHREGPRNFLKIETDRKAYFEWLDLLFIFGCSLLKFFEVSAMVDSYIEHQWHCWPRNGTFNHIDLSNKIDVFSTFKNCTSKSTYIYRHIHISSFCVVKDEYNWHATKSFVQFPFKIVVIAMVKHQFELKLFWAQSVRHKHSSIDEEFMPWNNDDVHNHKLVLSSIFPNCWRKVDVVFKHFTFNK